MAVQVVCCPKFLDLLGSFYETLPSPPPLQAELIRPEEIPQPYRALLDHRSDMTSTLQRHHGEEIGLRVIESRREGDLFFRHIVLEGKRSGRPLEYGAIRIVLSSLSAPARRQVRECRVPLGGILHGLGILHQICPGGFFRVYANSLMLEVFNLDQPTWLFGRCSCLANPEGQTIAEVVEILPPLLQSKRLP